MAPFYIAWLPPEVEQHPWWIPVAFLALLIPFFFASVWVERQVVDRFNRWPKSGVAAWSWQANALSYAVLGVVSVGFLSWALLAGWKCGRRTVR